MRKKATEIVVGVVLLSPGRGRERTQPTRGSARYSHFTEPHRWRQDTDWIHSSADWTPVSQLHIVSFSHIGGIFSPHEESLTFTQLINVCITSIEKTMCFK